MNNIYQPEFVKSLFDEMSGSYERMNYWTSFGFCIRWRKQFLKKLCYSKGQKTVIDLLSGRGENWKTLKSNFPNSQFFALDFSKQMIKNSTPRGNWIFKGSLKISSENVLENTLPDDYFDIVSCAYGLKTFEKSQLETLAKEVHRILKPGGKFAFVEVSKPSNKVISAVYGFYLGTIVPILGKVFLANSKDYRMLWIYVSRFKNCQGVQHIFEKEGLEVNFDSYFLGCATGVSGHKP